MTSPRLGKCPRGWVGLEVGEGRPHSQRVFPSLAGGARGASRSGVPAAASSWLSHSEWRHPRPWGTTRARTTCASAAPTARSWRGLAWPGETLGSGVRRVPKASVVRRPRSRRLEASWTIPPLTTCAFSAAAADPRGPSPGPTSAVPYSALKLPRPGFGVICLRHRNLHRPVS